MGKWIIRAAIFLFICTSLMGVKTTRITPKNTDVTFKAASYPFFGVDGKFTIFTGTLVWNDAKTELLSAYGMIQVRSLTTNNDARDFHLKSHSFFHSKTYPTLTFKSTHIVRTDPYYNIVGTLTLRGITKDVAFALKREESDDGVILSGSLPLNRFDFGMTGYKYRVKRRVTGTVKIRL